MMAQCEGGDEVRKSRAESGRGMWEVNLWIRCFASDWMMALAELRFCGGGSPVVVAF